MMKYEEEVVMMMEDNAEVESSGTEEEFGGRPQIIAKRKRTKRRRLSTSGVCGSVSSTEAGGEKDRNYESSVTTTTEEEEDMANCLILLARSGSIRRSFGNDDEVNFDESLVKTVSEIRKPKKIETISSSSLIHGGVNSNVLYECKTCDKAFQSFQALGGHRASHHKKPKNLFPDNHTKVKPPTAKTSVLPVVSRQPSPPPATHSSPKVHECSICGSAFSSGQALGGHMRRHRTTTTSTVVTASNDHDNQIGVAADVDVEPVQTEKVAVLVSDRYVRNDESDNNTNNNFLASLDLNLPAPDEDDQMSHSTQRRRLFPATVQGGSNPSTTAPPLVGCYF